MYNLPKRSARKPSLNMSSTAAIIDKPSANRSSRSSDRYFFSGMALLLLGTVLLGFAKTYFLAGVFHAPPLPDWIIHVHGAAFTLWIVLLIVQIALVSAHRTDIHRRLGLAGFGLAVLMVILGVMAATDLLRRGEAALGVDARTFYAGTLGDMFAFAVLVFFAYRYRRNSAAHKRLIVIATITLMQAAVNRWPFAIIDRLPIVTPLIAYSFLIPLFAYDFWSSRKINPATLCGGLFMVIVQELEFPIGRTMAWQNFATWVLAHAKSLHGS